MAVTNTGGTDASKGDASSPESADRPLSRGRITNVAEVVLRADENLRAIYDSLLRFSKEMDLLKSTAATADARLANLEKKVEAMHTTLDRIWTAVQQAQKSEHAQREEMSQDLVARMGKQVELSLDDRVHRMERAHADRAEQLEQSKRSAALALVQKQMGALVESVGAMRVAESDGRDEEDPPAAAAPTDKAVPSAAVSRVRRARDGAPARSL